MRFQIWYHVVGGGVYQKFAHSGAAVLVLASTIMISGTSMLMFILFLLLLGVD